MAARPYTTAIPDEDVEELRRRLAETRWPALMSGSGWDYGTDDANLRDVVG